MSERVNESHRINQNRFVRIVSEQTHKKSIEAEWNQDKVVALINENNAKLYLYMYVLGFV